MKHAYLIIAHHEFEVLEKLISTLDDPRNDIYILIDKKTSIVPDFSCKSSGLFFLGDGQRVPIYWGHVSQIKAEYALFQAASQNGHYEYYHLISGTHLPLKSQNFIHSFFEQHKGMQLLQPMENNNYEINIKMRKLNYFVKYYKHPHRQVRNIAQILWRRALVLQSLLRFAVNREDEFVKAANWASLTHNCVNYLISRKDIVLKKYAMTFCGDEFFVPSELMASQFREQCLFYPHLVYSKIDKDTSELIRKADCEKLLQTDYLFARKFGQEDMDSVNSVIAHIEQEL